MLLNRITQILIFTSDLFELSMKNENLSHTISKETFAMVSEVSILSLVRTSFGLFYLNIPNR